MITWLNSSPTGHEKEFVNESQQKTILYRLVVSIDDQPPNDVKYYTADPAGDGGTEARLTRKAARAIYLDTGIVFHSHVRPTGGMIMMDGEIKKY